MTFLVVCPDIFICFSQSLVSQIDLLKAKVKEFEAECTGQGTDAWFQYGLQCLFWTVLECPRCL